MNCLKNHCLSIYDKTKYKFDCRIFMSNTKNKIYKMIEN